VLEEAAVVVGAHQEVEREVVGAAHQLRPRCSCWPGMTPDTAAPSKRLLLAEAAVVSPLAP
jgi:hypothetical protein